MKMVDWQRPFYIIDAFELQGSRNSLNMIELLVCLNGFENSFKETLILIFVNSISNPL
jgi:hypothetical protein